MLCTDSQILRAFFAKSTFHQSVMTSSIKLPYLKNAMSDFTNFCVKIEMKDQPFRKEQKVNFDLLRQLVPFDVLSHNYLSSHSLTLGVGLETLISIPLITCGVTINFVCSAWLIVWNSTKAKSLLNIKSSINPYPDR